MRKTENETTVFEPRYHVAVHNVDKWTEAIFGPIIGVDPDKPWDVHWMVSFPDVEDAIREADRLHKKYLSYMKESQQPPDGAVFSWFSVEMELQPHFYTLVYWPGRTITVDEVRAAAAHAQIAAQNLTSNTTRH